MRLSEIIPNLDPNGVYVFNIMIDQSQGRHITATMDTATAVVMSPSLGGDGTQMQVQMASDKVLTVVYTGAGLLASAQNGKVELEITAHSDPEGENRSIVVTNIHIDELRANMSLPIAMRVGAGYRYGFNGMERDDEVKGSGNSYTTEFRQLDSRLGIWWGRDPLKAELPWQSPYIGMDNNPIWYTDVRGDSVDIGNLQDKNKDGSFKNLRELESFETFASTSQGEQYLLDRAQDGFNYQGVINKELNIQATEAGKLNNKGIDLKFNVGNLKNNDSGNTGMDVIDGRLKLQINLDRTSLNGKSSIFDGVLTIAHESLYHGSLYEKKYLSLSPSQRTKRNIYTLGNYEHTTPIAQTDFYRIGTDLLRNAQKSLGLPMQSREDIFYNIVLPAVKQ